MVTIIRGNNPVYPRINEIESVSSPKYWKLLENFTSILVKPVLECISVRDSFGKAKRAKSS